tara:strand:+ start:684 stop:1169 length:486 start_codon:yes stop_codon:yes gene_type:complete
MFCKKILVKDGEGNICECLIGDHNDDVEAEIDHVLSTIGCGKNAPRLEVELDAVVNDQDPAGNFQGAWEFDDDKNPTSVVINVDKAKPIKVEWIRQLRNSTLQVLDKDVIIALGKGDKNAVEKIETKKQKLRDIPKDILPAVNKCKTLQQLQEIVPPELIF